MSEFMQIADKGKWWRLTQKGYDETPDAVKKERAVGQPIIGFEKKVPVSWIAKGYVEQK